MKRKNKFKINWFDKFLTISKVYPQAASQLKFKSPHTQKSQISAN